MLQCVDGVKLGAMCAMPELPHFHGQVGRCWQLWEEGPAPKPCAGSPGCLSPTYKALPSQSKAMTSVLVKST
jgi:hypothetical protein